MISTDSSIHRPYHADGRPAPSAPPSSGPPPPPITGHVSHESRGIDCTHPAILRTLLKPLFFVSHVTASRLPVLAALVGIFLPATHHQALAGAFDSVVVINEIHYHPDSAAKTEWVELRNQQGVDMNLSRWSLTGGIEFTFPDNFTALILHTHARTWDSAIK